MRVHSFNCLRKNVDHCPSVFAASVEVQPLGYQLGYQNFVERVRLVPLASAAMGFGELGSGQAGSRSVSASYGVVAVFAG